jgi:hypothetical protein
MGLNSLLRKLFPAPFICIKAESNETIEVPIKLELLHDGWVTK